VKLVIFTGQQASAWQTLIQSTLSNHPQLSLIDGSLAEFVADKPTSLASSDTQDNESVYYAYVDELDALKGLALSNIDYQLVLFYAAPDSIFTPELNSDTLKLDQHVQRWTAEAEDLLEIYLNHNANSRLYQVQQCQDRPAQFFTALQAQLNLTDLLFAIETEPSQPQYSHLMALWAGAFIRENPALELVYEQLESAAECLQPEPAAMTDPMLLLQKGAADLHMLLAHTAEKIELEAKQTQLELTITGLESQLQISQTENQQLNAGFTQLQSKTIELTDENELCLLQISQLQEELEQSFANAQGFESQVKELMNNQTSSQSLVVEKLATLENEVARMALENQQLSEENELCLLQINQLQEELEYYYLQYQRSTVWHPLTQIDKALPQHLTRSLTLIQKLEPMNRA
jgi:hypothetical protein